METTTKVSTATTERKQLVERPPAIKNKVNEIYFLTTKNSVLCVNLCALCGKKYYIIFTP